MVNINRNNPQKWKLWGPSIMFMNVKWSWDPKFDSTYSRCSINVWWVSESMKWYKENKQEYKPRCVIGVSFWGLPQALGWYHTRHHTEKWMRIKSCSVSERKEVFHGPIDWNSVLNGSRNNDSLKILNKRTHRVKTPPSPCIGSKYHAKFLGTTPGFPLSCLRKCEFGILLHGMFPGRVTKHTTLERSQPASIDATPLGGMGVGSGWQWNTQASLGRPQGEGAGATLQRTTELHRPKHMAKLLTAENQQQPTDWSAVPQTETGRLFWAKALGQMRLSGKEQLQPKSKENLYDAFYERRIVSCALPICSATTAQLYIRSPILKNKEVPWGRNGEHNCSLSIFFFFFWELPSHFIYAFYGYTCANLILPSLA